MFHSRSPINHCII